MPCKFTKFRSLQHRIRRTMHYGRDDLNSLTEPLSRMVVDYFKHNFSTSDPLDMEFLATFSSHRCVNPCTLLVAMIYMNRMRLVDGMRLAHDEGRASGSGERVKRPSSELFLLAMILASKYLNDGGLNEFIWNDEFASASKLDVAKINRLELQMLDELNWELLVDEKTFNSAVDAAERWIAAETLKQNGFLTYNEINVFATDSALFLSQAEQFLTAFMTILATYAAIVALLFCTVALPLTVTQGGRENNSQTVTSASTYCSNLRESMAHNAVCLSNSIVSSCTINSDENGLSVSSIETEQNCENKHQALETRESHLDWLSPKPLPSLYWDSSLLNGSSSIKLMDWLLLSPGSGRRNMFAANVGSSVELRAC